jgi:hypothetical protein
MPTSAMQIIRIACLLALTAICGCGRTTDDVEITGTATWNGSPLNYASVIFYSTNPQVAAVGGTIIKGKFKVRLKPGQVRVAVEAVRNTNKRDPIDNLPLAEMYIPDRYNSKTQLTAEVTRDGDNHFDFALTE